MADEDEFGSHAGSEEDEDRVALPEVWKLAARDPGHLRVLKHLRDPENADCLRQRHPETRKSIMQFLFESCDEDLFLKVLKKFGRELLPVSDTKVFEIFDKFKEMTAPKEEDEEEEEEEEEVPEEDEFDEEGNLIPRPPKPDLAQKIAAELEDCNEFVVREIIHCGIYAGDRLESSRERHGFGGTLYTNGDLFVGEYRYGVRYEGVYVHATSHDIYRGTFNSKGLRHGQGKIWYNDESVYEGSWVQGVREGHGVFSFSNRDQYEGEWLDDCMHGRGTLSVEKTRETLSGDWYRNTFMAGRWTQASGAVYYGLFRDFQPYGRGMYQLPNGIFELGSYDDSVWIRDRILHKVVVSEVEDSLTDWRSKLRNRVVGLGSVCPTTIQTDVFKAESPDFDLGVNTLMDFPALVRGLSAPPRPPTPPNWDDEGLEGEGVGEAGEVEELMKCHGFLLDTLRLAQWLNGFSDFACGIAAVGDDINVGSCAGNLRVLDDPSEESTALAVTFAVPKGKTCGTTIMYPGPSLSRDHVRREDVWSNIRSSSVLLLDGSLLLNSADVVAMVLEQASKQPKTVLAFKFPAVCTVDIVNAVVAAVAAADVVFCTDLEMHSFAQAKGWRTNNLQLLMERLSKLYAGPRKQVIVLADAFGDTYVMDAGKLQVFPFPTRPEPEVEEEEEEEEKKEVVEEQPQEPKAEEADVESQSEDAAPGEDVEVDEEKEEGEEDEDKEDGEEEDKESGEEEEEEDKEKDGEGEEGERQEEQSEGDVELEVPAEPEEEPEPEVEAEPEPELVPEPEPEPIPEDPRSTVGVAPVNLAALAAGFVSQLSWPHATPNTAQCVRAGLYSVFAVNQGRSFEPTVDGDSNPRPLQLAFSRSTRPFELVPVRAHPEEEQSWEDLAAQVEKEVTEVEETAAGENADPPEEESGDQVPPAEEE